MLVEEVGFLGKQRAVGTQHHHILYLTAQNRGNDSSFYQHFVPIRDI